MNLTDNFYSRRVMKYNPYQIELAKAIYNLYKPGSVYDMGCGIGGYLDGFNSCGCSIRGSDYGWDVANKYMSEIVRKNTYKHNASEPIEGQCKFDLVISIEVAEHLEEKTSIIFCENLVGLASNRIIFTAAGPEQPGNGHINCQVKQYWIDRMLLCGAMFDGIETDSLYGNLINIDKIGICKNLMVFKVGAK